VTIPRKRLRVYKRINNVIHLRNVFYLVILAFLLSSCASASNLQKLSIGMDKVAVQETIGPPRIVRNSMVKGGQIVDVWEYRLDRPYDSSARTIAKKTVMTVFTLGIAAVEFAPDRDDYWLFFVNDRLIQWKKTGEDPAASQ
jgi:hypothetical protein